MSKITKEKIRDCILMIVLLAGTIWGLREEAKQHQSIIVAASQ